MCVSIRIYVQGVPGVKVTTSGVTSLADAESKTSYTHGSNSQRFRSYEVWKKLERKEEYFAFIVIHNVLFTDEAHFTRDGVNNTRNSRLLDHDNLHRTVESNYQYSFSVNVWCGVTGDQLIGPYIFPQRLTGDI